MLGRPSFVPPLKLTTAKQKSADGSSASNLVDPKTEDDIIKSLYHENKKIRKNLRDLSEHLSTQLEKQKLNILRAHKQSDNAPPHLPGLSKYNPRDIE